MFNSRSMMWWMTWRAICVRPYAKVSPRVHKSLNTHALGDAAAVEGAAGAGGAGGARGKSKVTAEAAAARM